MLTLFLQLLTHSKNINWFFCIDLYLMSFFKTDIINSLSISKHTTKHIENNELFFVTQIKTFMIGIWSWYHKRPQETLLILLWWPTWFHFGWSFEDSRQKMTRNCKSPQCNRIRVKPTDCFRTGFGSSSLKTITKINF